MKSILMLYDGRFLSHFGLSSVSFHPDGAIFASTLVYFGGGRATYVWTAISYTYLKAWRVCRGSVVVKRGGRGGAEVSLKITFEKEEAWMV